MKFSIWDPKAKEMLYGTADTGFSIFDFLSADYPDALVYHFSDLTYKVRHEIIFRPWVGVNTVANKPIYDGDYITWDGGIRLVAWVPELVGFNPWATCGNLPYVAPIYVLGNKYEHTYEDCLNKV